jgi:hypothetical protein
MKVQQKYLTYMFIGKYGAALGDVIQSDKKTDMM